MPASVKEEIFSGERVEIRHIRRAFLPVTLLPHACGGERQHRIRIKQRPAGTGRGVRLVAFE